MAGFLLTWASSNPNYSIHYCLCEHTFLPWPSWWIWELRWGWEWWWCWGGELVLKAIECRFQTVSLFIPIWFQIYCPIKHKLVWQSNHVKKSSLVINKNWFLFSWCATKICKIKRKVKAKRQLLAFVLWEWVQVQCLHDFTRQPAKNIASKVHGYLVLSIVLFYRVPIIGLMKIIRKIIKIKKLCSWILILQLSFPTYVDRRNSWNTG